MIYIDLLDKNELITQNKESFIINLKRNVFNKFSKIRKIEFENNLLILIPNLSKNTFKKVKKILDVKCEKILCISNRLDANVIYHFLGQELKIFDGSWLYKYLIFDIIFYIIQSKKETLEGQEISILCHKNNEILIEFIREIAGKIKLLNIVTQNEHSFKDLEQKMYRQKGITLNINNNYQKSLIKSNIVINYDLENEELNKYSFNKKSCIINFIPNAKIMSKSFEGVNIVNYETSLPEKYLKYKMNLKNFENKILYESFIYKNTSVKNIRKEIEDDGVNIIGLIGVNGRIRKTEMKNLKLNKKIS